jgi:DNA polymerase II small subunit
MGLVEDLLSNKYLITPSAYYLLSDSYKKDFTLAELIKFARARDTFVIDSALAEEFLREKGLLSVEVPVEESTVETEEPEVEFPEEDSLKGEIGSDMAEIEETGSIDQEVSENASLAASSETDGETYVSTGTSAENTLQMPSFSENKEEEPEFSGVKSFVSTGTLEQGVASEPVNPEITPTEEAEMGATDEILPVESENTTEETAESVAEPEPLPIEQSSEEGSSEDTTPFEPPAENGNGYSNGNGYADSEEYYEENGNGIKPKIVYGDYGIPIAYTGDEVPEEEKSYSVYSDVVITPKEGFHYRAKEIPDE